MRVKSCVASDGGGHTIQLSDEFGCVLRPKMISRFLKARGSDDRATVITYAFFHAFKFPDALSVHIKCKVNDVGYKYTTDETAYDQRQKYYRSLIENIVKPVGLSAFTFPSHHSQVVSDKVKCKYLRLNK